MVTKTFLNGNLKDIETVSITLDSKFNPSAKMYFQKLGKLVIASYTGNTQFDKENTIILVANIPEKFIPPREVNVTYKQINKNATGTGRWNFLTSGVITVYAQLAGYYESKFCTCWLLE